MAQCYLGFRPSISIHAPREGGDKNYTDTVWAGWGISIHAPREGGDISIVFLIINR